MKILVGGSWEDGFLDPWRAPDEVRVAVRRWCVVEELDDLYFTVKPSVRKLLDYGREVGPVEVARKVWSRLAESVRNDKVAACGTGVVVEGPGWNAGEEVTFFAPCTPRGVERVVLPPELVWRVAENSRDGVEAEAVAPDFGAWAGWRRESGIELSEHDGLAQLQQFVAATLPHARKLDIGSPTAVCERRIEDFEPSGRSTALFGYGHYARTVVLPSLPDELRVIAVHELDPMLVPEQFPIVDTAPILRPDERYDVVFAAGYHSSHAPLAADALCRGSYAVSEKPLATTREQLSVLLSEWGEPSRYFAGFHRRYSGVNDWLRRDLAWNGRNPLSYHAIVHEVKLPARHWYRWPSSGSRLLSNGCHWIDHFLFLNDFAEVRSTTARRGPTGEIQCSVTLENDAHFTLTLTDRGSDRLGVREHTEVRVEDRTAVITDFSRYVAEGPGGLIRRRKFHRLAAHKAMYARIAEKILAGEPGDSRASVSRSAQTVLDLQEQL